MLLAKQQILEMINNLPEEIDVDELMYRLYLWQKLQSAEDDVSKGRLLSHEDLTKESSQWFK